MGDEVLEADPVLGVPLEQVVEEVGELRRGAAGNPRGQSGISLVELLQSLEKNSTEHLRHISIRSDLLKKLSK